MTSNTLDRTVFVTNRALEFFSETELRMQIGHSRRMWPVALVKELVDNALDACETAGVVPEIEICLEADAVWVRDNGPGLPVEVLEKSLDYLVRVSDKTHYTSPTRGQLGNALKCVWAAPFVAHGEYGQVDVITGGLVHEVRVSLDRIAQKPRLEHDVCPDGLVKTGTLVRMHWPGLAWLHERRRRGLFLQVGAWLRRLQPACQADFESQRRGYGHRLADLLEQMVAPPPHLGSLVHT